MKVGREEAGRNAVRRSQTCILILVLPPDGLGEGGTSFDSVTPSIKWE